jgi:bacteriocin biosynthesis cyclodehydratase domain-containing protein
VFHSEGEDNIWLRGALVGRILPQLLPLLNGTSTLEEIITRLGADQRKDIVTVLRLLKERRIVEEGDVKLPLEFPTGYLDYHAEQIRFLSHFHNEQYQAQAHLFKANVTLIDNQTSYGDQLANSLAGSGLGGLKLIKSADLAHQSLDELEAPTALAETLAHTAPYTKVSAHRWGYEWLEAATQVAPPLGTPASYQSFEPLLNDASLLVVLTEGYSSHICDVVNEIALKKGIRWLSLSLKGSNLILGPAILPRATACWRCYQSRVWANATREENPEMLQRFDEHYHATAQTSQYGLMAAVSQIVAGLGANEIIKAITLYSTALYGRVQVYNVATSQTHQADVLRLPRCKACGRDRLTIPNKLWYTSRPLAESNS